MKWTGLNELRELYLSFFETKGHLRHESYSLIPEGDKSLLLIVAGMAPLKKYFTGEAVPPRNRMTTCQRCIRTNDIENVGYTARHGTYFEMLGNFSFGDYFKNEALAWAWEFLTDEKWLAIPAERLYPSIYENDDEAFEIWNKKIGVPAKRIVRLGKEDNFWEHGSGPCGPCSEIYFDRGEKYGCGKPTCGPGCDCDRFMEIWNNVFSQFNNDGNGNYTELAHKNIDTGMGLERLACVMQGVDSMFEVDTIRNIISAVSGIAGVNYHDDPKSDVSLRIIADHMRASSFLIADGVLPSNEGRGYILRRLIRRACRHGRLLGIKKPFINDIIEVVTRENASAYPLLVEKLDYVKKIAGLEEERFNQTVESGMTLLDSVIADAKKSGSKLLKGEDVFKLSDTFGFPIDLTREIAEENGLEVDEDGYKALMQEQKQRARDARANISGWDSASKSLLSDLAKTEFVGYSAHSCEAKVIAIVADDTLVESVSEGDFTLVLDKTPFYGESGGQVGDTGTVSSDKASVTVSNTGKTNGVYYHVCTLDDGEIKVGDTVKAVIDSDRRNAIARNHSACHLLQAALRQVLGDHVNQAGSYVDENRLRFDFSHYEPMTTAQIAEVEKIVNAHILAGEKITTEEMDIETAKNTGARALFGEKYGQTVRVVSMGDFSKELCGGTHLDNTAKAGLFKIVSESSVAAGVRRVEAATGLGILAVLAEKDELINDTARELKVQNPLDISRKAVSLQNELRTAKKEIETLNAKIASAQTANIKNSAITVEGINVIAYNFENGTVDMARSLCDDLKASDDNVVAVISVVTGDKLLFASCCGKNAVGKGAHAGNILKAVSKITGGGGGGRPDSASSGGKDVTKLAEAFAEVPSIVRSMLK